MESTILLLWLLGAIVFVLGTIVFSSEQRKIWLERLRTGRWDITASANQQRQGTGSSQGQFRYVLSTGMEDEIREAFVAEKLRKFTKNLDASDIQSHGKNVTEQSINCCPTEECTSTTSSSISGEDEHNAQYTYLEDENVSRPVNQVEQQIVNEIAFKDEYDVENPAPWVESLPDGQQRQAPDEECGLLSKEVDGFEKLQPGETISSAGTALSEPSLTANSEGDCHSVTKHDVELGMTEDDEALQSSMNGLFDESISHIFIPLAGESMPADEGNEESRSNDSNKSVAADESDKPEIRLARKVPNGCAICLSSFHVDEKVSWSSNPGCKHVFHHDCVLDWFSSSGKKQIAARRPGTDQLRFQTLDANGNSVVTISTVPRRMTPAVTSTITSTEASDGTSPASNDGTVVVEEEDDAIRRITNFQMLCPCCRQDFFVEQTLPTPSMEEL